MSKYGACPSRRVYQAFDFSRSSARITTVRNPWNIVRLLATASLPCGPSLRRNIGARAEVIFGAAHAVAMPGWLLLIVVPRWRWTQRLVVSGGWSAVLSVVHLFVVAVHMPGAPGGFGALAQVATLFANPMLLLAGW